MESRIWNGVDILRRPLDGYVNATAMCKAYGRDWFTYARSDRTKSYIAALERSLGSPQNCGDLVQMITTGPNHLRGTWVHPRIAVDLARWLHPEFAVMMDGWFLESFTPKIAADPNPATSALPPQQRELLEYQVGGPGINVLGATAFSEPLTEILDAYTTQTEAEQQALPQPQRCRSLRFPRPAAKHFLEWFVAQHGQLVISPAPIGIPVGAVACPPRPPAPPAPAPQPPRDHQARAIPQQRFNRGDLITGPELAHLLGISSHSLNKWAGAKPIGAERAGWRLIGRGKLSAGKLCSTYPPGCASWLFMKL
jgi:hypothetical protein